MDRQEVVQKHLAEDKSTHLSVQCIDDSGDKYAVILLNPSTNSILSARLRVENASPPELRTDACDVAYEVPDRKTTSCNEKGLPSITPKSEIKTGEVKMTLANFGERLKDTSDVMIIEESNINTTWTDASTDNDQSSLKTTNETHGNVFGNDSGLGSTTLCTSVKMINSVVANEIPDTISHPGLRKRNQQHDQIATDEVYPNERKQTTDDIKQNAPADQSNDEGTPRSVETKTQPEHIFQKLATVCSSKRACLCSLIILGIVVFVVMTHQVKVVQQEHLIALADELHHWKKLARYLRVEEKIIRSIANDYKEDVYEQGYQMLLHWKETNGQEASIKNLVTALERLKRKDLVTKLFII